MRGFLKAGAAFAFLLSFAPGPGPGSGSVSWRRPRGPPRRLWGPPPQPLLLHLVRACLCVGSCARSLLYVYERGGWGAVVSGGGGGGGAAAV